MPDFWTIQCPFRLNPQHFLLIYLTSRLELVLLRAGKCTEKGRGEYYSATVRQQW